MPSQSSVKHVYRKKYIYSSSRAAKLAPTLRKHEKEENGLDT
jgi:hypothetical protein